MAYAYQQRKRSRGADAPEPLRTAVPGPDLDALRTGLARPSAAQKGSSIDLDAHLRARMENAFGDLSGVKLYRSRAVADAGAEAMTMGNEIAFAPGKDDFSTREGQQRLGHELSHAALQRSGAVRGGGFLESPALEARADREGAMAAAGQQVYGGAAAPLSAAAAAPAAGPMQAVKKKGKKSPAPSGSVQTRVVPKTASVPQTAPETAAVEEDNTPLQVREDMEEIMEMQQNGLTRGGQGDMFALPGAEGYDELGENWKEFTKGDTKYKRNMDLLNRAERKDYQKMLNYRRKTFLGGERADKKSRNKYNALMKKRFPMTRKEAGSQFKPLPENATELEKAERKRKVYDVIGNQNAFASYIYNQKYLNNMPEGQNGAEFKTLNTELQYDLKYAGDGYADVPMKSSFSEESILHDRKVTADFNRLYAEHKKREEIRQERKRGNTSVKVESLPPEQEDEFKAFWELIPDEQESGSSNAAPKKDASVESGSNDDIDQVFNINNYLATLKSDEDLQKEKEQKLKVSNRYGRKMDKEYERRKEEEREREKRLLEL